MASDVYGCHNGRAPVAGEPLLVQDGWVNLPGGTRIARMVTVPYVMSTTCRYDAAGRDTRCTGCWRAVLD